MKYLVNRETKEHKILTDNTLWSESDWRMVDSDDEGWIDCTNGVYECPVHDSAEVEFRTVTGESVRSKHPNTWAWGNFKTVKAYRPILPAESKPTLEETWHKIKQEAKVDVFTRLASAVAASESIPALIAEINAMLHPRFEVREKEYISDMISDPGGWSSIESAPEDMSDWRNWKEGDILECISAPTSWWKLGKLYAVRLCGNSMCIIDGDGDERPLQLISEFFKPYSRPEAK